MPDSPDSPQDADSPQGDVAPDGARPSGGLPQPEVSGFAPPRAVVPGLPDLGGPEGFASLDLPKVELPGLAPLSFATSATSATEAGGRAGGQAGGTDAAGPTAPQPTAPDVGAPLGELPTVADDIVAQAAAQPVPAQVVEAAQHLAAQPLPAEVAEAAQHIAASADAARDEQTGLREAAAEAYDGVRRGMTDAQRARIAAHRDELVQRRDALAARLSSTPQGASMVDAVRRDLADGGKGWTATKRAAGAAAGGAARKAAGCAGLVLGAIVVVILLIAGIGIATSADGDGGDEYAEEAYDIPEITGESADQPDGGIPLTGVVDRPLYFDVPAPVWQPDGDLYETEDSLLARYVHATEPCELSLHRMDWGMTDPDGDDLRSTAYQHVSNADWDFPVYEPRVSQYYPVRGSGMSVEFPVPYVELPDDADVYAAERRANATRDMNGAGILLDAEVTCSRDAGLSADDMVDLVRDLELVERQPDYMR
ncbi:hypothetical protein [Microbacterium sp. NPDC096154]|uniref:hypothetical protein n=1 Tax=Microbacterium sp. NPDC096154 TaxID=3155549 RepID=UPI0033171FBB